MNIYIPPVVLGALLALLLAVPAAFGSLLVLAVVSGAAGFSPPNCTEKDVLRLLAFGQFVGGMVYGWWSKGLLK